MYIYLITNKINGKKYVGRTARSDYRRRWSEHKKDGRKPNARLPISRALHKYGIDSFSYEIIEKVDSIDLLPSREAYYIQYHNSLSPAGYNLETYQPNRIFSQELKAKMSSIQQGRAKKPISKKTSRYVGVFKNHKAWMMLITKNYVDYTKTFKSEEDAARAYDKMAIYLYGKGAQVNFPSESYSKEDVQRTYEYVTAETKTSKYIGVHFSTPLQRWRGIVKFKDGSAVNRRFSKEEDAAKFIDVVRVVHFNAPKDSLNFPELYEKYKTKTAEWITSFTPEDKVKLGVSYRDGKYTARIGNSGKIHCGTYATEQEAIDAITNKRREMNILWDL